jgi:hypothetical protein
MGRESRSEAVRKCKQCSFEAIVTAAGLRDHVAASHREASASKPFRKLNPDEIWDRVRNPGKRYGHRKTVAEREAYLRAKVNRRAA